MPGIPPGLSPFKESIMRVSELKSPGNLSMGVALRKEAAKAISAIQMAQARGATGSASTVGNLLSFFHDCAQKVAAYAIPSSAVVENDAPDEVVLTFPAPVSTTAAPAAARFSVEGQTIDSVAFDDGDLVITLTAPLTAEDGSPAVTYTPNGTNDLTVAETGTKLRAFTLSIRNNVEPSE